MPRDGKASITVDEETQEMLQRNKPDGVTWDRFLSQLLYATDDKGDKLPCSPPKTCPGCGGNLDAIRVQFNSRGVAICPHCDERIAAGRPLGLPADMDIIDIGGTVIETVDMDANALLDALENRIEKGGA